MMRIAPNYIITMNRGDTAVIPLELNLGSAAYPEYYELKDGDFVYFALLEANQKWENAILKKTLSLEDYDSQLHIVNIRFEPEDTEYLLPGNYYYQIKLFRSADNTEDKFDHVDTIIDRTRFTILN